MSPEKIEWVQMTDWQRQLREVLANDAFKQAVLLAMEDIEGDVDLSDESTIEKNAILHAKGAGARAILKGLKKLSAPPKEWFDLAKEKPPLPPPYDYLKQQRLSEKKSTVA